MILNCFHFDIHIYIKYSTLINGDKHWNYIVITQKLNQNYMNFDIYDSGPQNQS